ncbi:TSCPD domain-containing protein [Roseomonas sp. E05]|uniref:TSCPD domain-containing protein n=1 Tax=Roseomonas sp. E05 TaxID=3046310 RepID=UPI0024BB71C7|nr:TSCPD domain-containing protein [Roseomonas sp. E05]MDJ0387920.1 TSCPD domain-containing protein [Roseomonas sp. E05]
MAGTAWEGIALRRTRAAADPDSEPRSVALPAVWEDEAAAALALLAPGTGPVSLPALAEGWIGRLVGRGLQAGLLEPAEAPGLAESLRRLVLSRRGVPGAAIWRGEGKAEPRFVLNLSAFLDDAGGFDSAAYSAAAGTAVLALEILTGGKATRLRLGFADLAGLLAALGLDYDSEPARDVAGCLAALTRGAAECASARLAERLGAREPAALLWPAPPARCVVPGLALAARRALDAAGATHGLRHQGCFVLTAPDAAEALLGAETGGLAPAQGATRYVRAEDGAVVERPTRAARRAEMLHGARAAALLAPVPDSARAAMERAVSPYLHAASPAPLARPEPARPLPPPRPALAGGTVWKVVVGGHRVTLRAAEARDGSLAEITLSMGKEGSGFRGLLEGFLLAVNIGLARGVPLSDYVAAFAYTRFGPAGAVEGDGEILCATSVLDWAFRRLAMAYLDEAAARQLWPDPSLDECAAEATGTPADRGPMLPLSLPVQPSPAARRRSFRLVG